MLGLGENACGSQTIKFQNGIQALIFWLEPPNMLGYHESSKNHCDKFREKNVSAFWGNKGLGLPTQFI